MPLGPERDMENSHRISLCYAVLRGPFIAVLGDVTLGSSKTVKMVAESVVSLPLRSAGLFAHVNQTQTLTVFLQGSWEKDRCQGLRLVNVHPQAQLVKQSQSELQMIYSLVSVQ